jgi:hypothetical protein
MNYGNIPKKVLYHKINPDPCYDDTPMRLIDALNQLNEDVVYAEWSWNERDKKYLDSFTVWTTNKVAYLNHFLNEQYLATLPRNPPGA